MNNNDRTWEVTMRVRVTTMCGWEPEGSDIEGWLDDGSSLEFVAVDKVQEVKPVG
jgi:hypothetical protein